MGQTRHMPFVFFEKSLITIGFKLTSHWLLPGVLNFTHSDLKDIDGIYIIKFSDFQFLKLSGI